MSPPDPDCRNCIRRGTLILLVRAANGGPPVLTCKKCGELYTMHLAQQLGAPMEEDESQ